MNNYQAIVAEIKSITPIKGADNIHIAWVLNEPVIVSKDWTEGKVGLFFPVDCQLSEKYCYENNLHRDSTLNKDNEKVGFFDKNRKVRAQPFMKVKSCGYFTSLESLDWAASYPFIEDMTIGKSFDTFEGEEICRKFISPATLKALQSKTGKVGKKRVSMDAPLFHKHVDTSQFKQNLHRIPKGALISFHAKEHGTSARMTRTEVILPLANWKRSVNKFLPIFPEKGWEYLVGTRNVIRYPNQNDTVSFHGSEQFRYDVMDEVKAHLEKGMTIYGEISGWANGKPIMGVHSTDALKDKKFKKKYGQEMIYKYGCKEGDNRFTIYRITYTNHDGKELDFTVDQIHEWAAQRGLNSTLEISDRFIYNGDEDALRALVDDLTEREGLLTECYIDPSHISEGIIVRVDCGTQVPVLLKNKSFAFRCMEGIAKESEDFLDVEDAS